MPKFCHNCGKPVKVEDAKFCIECGVSFTEKSIEEIKVNKNESAVVSKKNIKSETEMEPILNENMSPLSNKDIGNMLEAFTAEILVAEGFKVEKNVRKKLDSKSIAEWDIIATKKIKDKTFTRIVECKNYGNSVQREKIDAFDGKLSSFSEIKNPNALFVSQSFSSGARSQAEYKNIELWDFKDLTERHVLSKIGRYGNQQKEIIIPYALPLLIDYTKITNLELKNSDKVSINRAKLFWRPFYKIKYSLNVSKSDPSGKSHTLKDEGLCFVDAQDGAVLNLPTPKENDTLLDIFPTIKFKDSEEDLFLKELKHESDHDYRIQITDEYQSIQIDPKISKHIARENAIGSIIYANTKTFNYEVKGKKRKSDDFDFDFPETRDFTIVPKKGDIIIKDTQIIHVPKWDIEFISGEKIYRREVIGHKGTIISDSISHCPQHKIIGLELFKKNTKAVCETDGKALCKDHVFQCPTCKKWNCDEHSMKCTICGTHYCSEHITNKCSDCESLVCYECSLKCPICGQNHCKKHWVKCDKCNTEICLSCTTTKTSMLVFKKYLCKKCQP
ncbi:MAG: restriction endonuclease [Candidatus Methanoperedens sp.]|nr:restriction endonuclease [Candidatus Methanoperedens sp.]